MTTAGPVRDSVLQAIGYAARVLTMPRFWLVPLVLSAISAAPLLLMPLPPGMGGYTPATTPAELEGYFRAFIPFLAASVLLSLVIGPFLFATSYRLAQQYVDGQDPNPWGPGIVALAGRFLLFALTLLLLYLGASLLLIALYVVTQAIVGAGLAVVIVLLIFMVATLILVIRLSLSPAMLLSGSGPIAALRQSWELTRGHFGVAFRWLFVSTMLIGIVVAVIGGAVGLVFGSIGQPFVGQVVTTVVAAPANVMQAIVIILLARLLSGPIEAPPPAPMPEWMTGSTSGG
jgi:hypothetical protein